MIVVADSGPPHYLILLGHIELLHRFYGQVAIPEAVANELRAAGSPAAVSSWIARPPEWVVVTPVPQEQIESITDDLDLGERAAIALAGTIRADLLLIDDAAGRVEATRRNLRVTGTLGVLRAGAEQGIIDVPDTVSKLKATSFYVDDALINTIFTRWLGP
jgi:predicted nucleic acid-binding protein